MGKKKGKKYGSIVTTVLMVLILALAGGAFAEQQFYPGYIDKDGEIGTDGKSWRIGYINTLVGEGPTSDGFETFVYYQDVAADVHILMANTSGTLATTAGAATSLTLADTKILIGNSGGLSTPQTMSGDASITNAGVVSLEAGTDAQMFIYNATEKWGPKTISGDITFTNAGVASIGSNAVGTAEANINAVTINIAAGSTTQTAEVESGSTLMGWYISNAGAVNVTTFANAPAFDGSTTWTMSINAADGGEQSSFVLNFLVP